MYDLHCHLDGSMRMSTLTELLQEKNYEIPDQIKFYPGMGLDEALSRFKTTLSVLQHPDAIERVVREICEDGADIGVGFTEIRFAPQLHHGAPIDSKDERKSRWHRFGRRAFAFSQMVFARLLRAI